MFLRWILLLAACALPAAAQIAPADWPNYTRDLAGTKYSPLDQITPGNVTKLVPAWTYTLRAEAPRASSTEKSDDPFAIPGAARTVASAATPIVVHGVMYLPEGNRVAALDPVAGTEIWSYTLPTGVASQRGVAYWPGDKQNPPRILFTSGHKLIALNANTGKIDPGFGNEGEVDMVVPYSGVPTIYKNVAIIGATVGEVPEGPPGDSRAYDARTGAKLWDFHSVPRPGELGHDTWLNDGWKGRSGVNVWGWYMTVDEKRGIVYMTFGGPAANYWGGDRPGNNLFANSVVAVDAVTGKYKWHFQTIHHDLWDSDLPPAPSLIDIVKDGKKIPALAVIGKAAWMFILDRTNGKPVFGVEERPVAKGDVPGEWYSPTQPFPLKPPPLARVSFKPDDIVTAEDTTPEHAKACREVYEKNGGFYNAGPFTGWLFHKDGTPPKSTIQFPGGTGGVNWGGTAADPRYRLRVLEHARRRVDGVDGEKEAGRELRPRHPGLGAALRSRQRGWARPVSRIQRDGEGCQRPRHRDLAVPKTTMGAAGCSERQHRRDRVAIAARFSGRAAGREAERRIERERGASGHGGWAGVYRRDQRSPVSRFRFEDGPGTVVGEAVQNGERESDDV